MVINQVKFQTCCHLTAKTNRSVHRSYRDSRLADFSQLTKDIVGRKRGHYKPPFPFHNALRQLRKISLAGVAIRFIPKRNFSASQNVYCSSYFGVVMEDLSSSASQGTCCVESFPWVCLLS